MAEVKLINVSKIYDDGSKAVKDITFTVRDKEFVVLVGPSGCGKTTTLRMIAGLELISDGEIFIGDQLVNFVSPKDRDIAMVFQNYALYPHMTVRENIAFGLNLRKYPKEEIKKRVNEAAEILGLKALLDRRPKALSGGQKQRVAVGRAIVRKPKVFLFDEPLSNLDAKLRVQMRAEISRLHSKLEATMIYVTHDQTEAMTMGDRIVILNDGEVQQINSPMEIYNNPLNKFVASFIGTPAMNFLNGKIEGGSSPMFVSENGEIKFGLNDSQKTAVKDYYSKKVIAGIRPEHLHLADDEINTAENSFNANIEVVEPMGSEVYMYLKTGSFQLVARVPFIKKFKPGTTVSLTLETAKTYFFNSETEKIIT